MFLQQSIKYLLISIVIISISYKAAFCSENVKISLDSILTTYDTYMKNSLEKQDVPGTAIAIVTDKQILFIKGYGVKKIGENEPVGIHSAFRIASLSKGFASVLSGLLVKDKVLDWDDRVVKYLPDFSLKNTQTTNNLTIRHLLSHTSGLMPYAYDNLIEANLPFITIIKRLKEVSVINPVGERYGYQNTVYSIISEVIESATNKTYNDLLKERIIQPLGMIDVSFSKNELLAAKDYAYPHNKRNWKWTPTVIRKTYYNVPPAAGINASVYDLALWLKGLLGGAPDVISADVVEDVCTPAIKTPRERNRYNWNNRLRSAYYGMGWRIFDYAGHTMVYHSGGLLGYLSELAFLPEHKIGIVVLTNGIFNNNYFVYKFADLYLNIEDENKSTTEVD